MLVNAPNPDWQNMRHWVDQRGRAMANIVIVVGHARRDTFCEALGEAYRAGAAEAGHDARLFVTSRMSFDPILHVGFKTVQPLELDLQAARAAMMAADHLVLIFPLWLGTLPAIFKGFLERVLQPDLVEPARTHQFKQVLKGKSARVIVTMGMPGIIYRWYYGAHAVKMLRRNILEFMGVSPVKSTIFGSVEAVSAEQRRAWINQAESLGRTAS
jgi:NAD(P)H dehydrogenase (quinone)